MANLNRSTVVPVLHNTNDFDYEAYNTYLSGIIPANSIIWTLPYQDHERLPGNIDIVEFLRYIGMRLDLWLTEIGYHGERPVYTGAYPDSMLSIDSNTAPINNDSPHRKIPWMISYKVRKKSPLSKHPPFSQDKFYKHRPCGYYKTASGEVYGVRMRQWESLLQFTILARSAYEADMYTRLFEQFMDLNERYFQAAGIPKIVPFGRLDEPIQSLEDAGIHYRKTVYWASNQEFQTYGPVDKIESVDIDVHVFET